MPEAPPSEKLPTDLAEHRAVRAWRQLCPDQGGLEGLEILRLKKKTSVYRLFGVGADGGTIVAKRCRAGTAQVERLVYQELLPRAGIPALQYFGWVPEPDELFCWLFLEDAGVEAYSPVHEEHRELAGRWLAAWHCLELPGPLRAALPDRSPTHYLQLISSSRTALQERVENPALTEQESALLRTLVAQCDLMQAHWPELERFFAAWPTAVVHGDFVIKNLRVRGGQSGQELLVFDWEMAGLGVPAVDLAQRLVHTANPDLQAYGDALRHHYPELTPGRLQRLAVYGNVLRLVDKVHWEAMSMRGQAYDFLVRPIATLQTYEPQLLAALRAIDWSARD